MPTHLWRVYQGKTQITQSLETACWLIMSWICGFILGCIFQGFYVVSLFLLLICFFPPFFSYCLLLLKAFAVAAICLFGIFFNPPPLLFPFQGHTFSCSQNSHTLRAPHTSTVCSSSTTTIRKYLVWNMDFKSFPRSMSLQPEMANTRIANARMTNIQVQNWKKCVNYVP